MAMNSSVTLVNQKLTDGSTKLKLVSPFVPGFSDKARGLGGTWNPTTKAWYFDLRDASRVRTLCLETFGVDPLAEPGDEPELVTVRVALDTIAINDRWFAFGREIVARPRRDARVILGDGVILVSGGFPVSGGSGSYPTVSANTGTLLEIRDVPRSLVDALIADRKRQAAALEAEATELDARLAADPDNHVAVNWRHNAKRNREKATVLRTGLTTVESAPAPERVPLAQEQMVALSRSLDPGTRRSAILSVLLSLDPSERKDLLAEIARFADQGAI